MKMNAATNNFLSLLRIFAQNRFRNMGDRQNDFQRRSVVGNEKYPEPLSDKFILDILQALEHRMTMLNHLRTMFDDDRYLEKADQLQWEFLRTPVIFEYPHRVSWESGSREVLDPVFDHNEIRIPASDMPPDALPYGIKTITELSQGFIVCFFELSQIDDLLLPVAPCYWRGGRDIVKSLHKISQSENLEEDDTTSSRQRPQKTVESNTQQQQMTPAEKVYNFIAQNSPVTTKTLLAQEFGCKERRLYDILQSLLKEKKITNPKYGVYKITNY